MSKLPFSKSQSTDEDYESDDSEIDKLRTRLVDPVEDRGLIEELLATGKPCLSYGETDPAKLLLSGTSLFVSETEDDGALAGLFLTDGSKDVKNVMDFLELTTAYELSALSAQYIDLMLCQPYKEGLTFEPLLKEIFATKHDLRLMFFMADIEEELPWYLKQFAKKLEYFDDDVSKNVYYIDSKDVLPKIHIAKAGMKDEDVLDELISQALPEYPYDTQKLLKGFIDTNHEVNMILGNFQEPLGVVVVNQTVDVEALSSEYNISAFNHFLAPKQLKMSELNINCFKIESYFMEFPGNPALVLSELFDKFSDKDYCIMMLPRDTKLSSTMVDMFFRVSPQLSTNPDQELFVCHKASLRGGVKVGQVKADQMTGLASLLRDEVKAEVILRDIRHSLETDGSDAQGLVATCCGQVIGLAVVRTEYEAELLRRNYDGDLGTDPVRLYHLIMAPVFQRFARFFLGNIIYRNCQICVKFSKILAQILKLTRKTSLIYPVFTRNTNVRESERYSCITALDEFQMAKPRSNLSCWSRVAKAAESPAKIQPPFTLFYINLTTAMLPMTMILEKVFILGSSPLALSAAETLSTRRLTLLPNLFLVTEDDETDFSPNVVNTAPTSWGQLDMGRRRRLSLYSTVNILLANVTKIDRKDKVIKTSDNVKYSYDRLILGVENSSYSLNNHFVCRKGIRKMKNFFTIDSLTSGRNCLDYFQGRCENYPKEGYIIILGHSLHALSITNSLIEMGAPAKSILLVKIDEEEEGNYEVVDAVTIKERIIHQIKAIGVRLKTYTLVDYKKDFKQDIINTIIFSKNEELVEAACIMIVNCSYRGVNRELLNVLDDSDIVTLEERVLIDNNYATNDPDILAAGSGTKLDRISEINKAEYETNQTNHGQNVANRMIEKILNMGDDGSIAKTLETFIHHTERSLPGGFTYLHLSNVEDLSAEKCLKTTSQDTEFRLYINESERISGVQVLHHGYLPSECLSRLAGLHISTFSGLSSAEDLLTFLQQPKFLAVFHEGFHKLRRQIRAKLLGREDSGKLIGEIVLNPEREETERMAGLRETWEERNFSRDVEERLREFLKTHKQELPCYKI